MFLVYDSRIKRYTVQFVLLLQPRPGTLPTIWRSISLLSYIINNIKMSLSHLINDNDVCISICEAGHGAQAQSVTVKSTSCGFDPHSRKWNIYLHLYFHFFALVWGKARRWVPPLSTQCLQNSAESEERSVLRLGSLCLPCRVRDTAWSSFNFLFISICFI